MSVNPFMPNVFSNPYQLDEPISNFRVVGWYFSFLFKLLFANSGELSGLFLRCLPMFREKDAVRLTVWFKANISSRVLKAPGFFLSCSKFVKQRVFKKKLDGMVA